MHQDRQRGIRVHVLILRRECVDARAYDHGFAVIERRRHIFAAREHVAQRMLEIRRQKRPALIGLLRLLTAPDVTAPDDSRPVIDKVGRQPDRLRVMQDHQIAGTYQREQFRGIVPQGFLVNRARCAIQSGTVAILAMQGVMQSFCDAEELRAAVDHQPANRNLEAPAIAQYRGQHLRHAAAHRGRVDVPDNTAVDALENRFGSLAQAFHGAWRRDRSITRKPVSMQIDFGQARWHKTAAASG